MSQRRDHADTQEYERHRHPHIPTADLRQTEIKQRWEKLSALIMLTEELTEGQRAAAPIHEQIAGRGPFIPKWQWQPIGGDEVQH